MTHDSNSDLIRMLNQIADFYKPYPREEAVQGISEHIILFWEPRMRNALAKLLVQDSVGLDELALSGAKATLK
jgi:formate dehydrogenase subunit delta